MLLCFSGASALIYQTVWMRQFRLIFGASTPANAAVLAIFMGGIGVGSMFLGRRADQHPRPLALYGRLEILIAITAAATPVLLELVRRIYIGISGWTATGAGGATIARLLLAALVLAVPTILMGGTLPAAAAAVEEQGDARRRALAILYAANTLGAVGGVLASTFWMLEHLGNRRTLLAAASVNLLIGVVAVRMRSRHVVSDDAPRPKEAAKPVLSTRVVLVAAWMVGFVFFLMEIVWYRMLTPLLGGTTFMFGLILAVALAGIGTGGWAYAWIRGSKPPSPRAFALTCGLEALALAFPLAIGDRLALLALALRADARGFGDHLMSWTILTVIVVLPAALVAGFQFPLLVALLGSGRAHVGRDVGWAYASNTAGAITAALAGGFVLLPLAGAPGCWQLSIGLLAALSLATLRRERWSRRLLPLAVVGTALAAMVTPTPTALWRHSGIGTGAVPRLRADNERTDWSRTMRRWLFVEREGRESSIALMRGDDLGLIVNGKSDGSARSDAGTQVMGGMLGVFLHPAPRSAMIIGLGTGTTAGWIGAIPSMETVDVVELEPAVVDVARHYSAVNRDVLRNPKVHIHIGDAREALVVSRATYDVIFSEPSNPHRAGVASLYTREFYDAAARRLRADGVFVQWVQMYAIDSLTVRTILATVGSVFPHVDIWTTKPGDIVLIASRNRGVLDADLMRARLAVEPYRSAAHVAWRVETVEGLLARFFASDALYASIAADSPALNTDDRPLIEFGAGRALGGDSFSEEHLYQWAVLAGATRPSRLRGSVDWTAVESNRASLIYLPSSLPQNEFGTRYAARDFPAALKVWRERPWRLVNSRQMATVAHVLAWAGDEAALPLIESLRSQQPIEADALTGLLRLAQKRRGEAAPLIAAVLRDARREAWMMSGILEATLNAAYELSADRGHAPAMLDALSRSFAAYQLEETRMVTYVEAAWQAGRCSATTIAGLRAMEPHSPWSRELLQLRETCYRESNLTELHRRAKEELERFNAADGS